MIVVHYGEIGLKGKNRLTFENLLVKNIKRALGDDIKDIKRDYGRIILYEIADSRLIIEKLSKIPGIENIAFALSTKLDIDEFKSAVIKMAAGKKFSSFKIETRRSNKSFPHTSVYVNELIGEYFQKKYQKKVDLRQPDLTIFVEIGNKAAYVYTEKVQGIGGLPIGSEGSVVSLLSGGIDSPVASWMMMKRGCTVAFVHFYNETLTSSQKKIENIIAHLTKTQLSSMAFFIPFGELQRVVISQIAAKYRMIVYRRFMIKLGVAIANCEKAMAIVTGDNIGQVASQTLENIQCIHAASELPVFAPLIGFNKREIIDTAQRIGTYDFSIQPYEDCCSFLIAKHPTVRTSLRQIKEMEQSITYDVDVILARATMKEFSVS